MLGEARELGIELELHAGREERHAFEQTLDIGVGAGVRVERQPAGDRRMRRRELAAQVAQEPQLGLVVAEEAPVHQRASAGRTLAAPSSRSIRVRSHSRSGTGLGPELRLDVEGDGVAGGGLGAGLHLDGAGAQPRLELADAPRRDRLATAAGSRPVRPLRGGMP